MTGSDAFPRVLFVTPHAFNKVTGGGITFTNLFQGWPQDHIATVHDDPEPTTGDVCRHYFTLGRAELDYVQPFAAARDLLQRGRGLDGGPSGPTARPDIHDATPIQPLASSGGLMNRLAGFGLDLLGGGLPTRGRLTPRLEAWIAEFRPQVLYTILGSNGMMDLIEAIRKRFDLPMVVHIMDDWMAARHQSGLLGPSLRRGMLRRVGHAMSMAHTRLSISGAMSEAFAARYGADFEAFQNTMDIARWHEFARKHAQAGRPADILYVGSIFPDAQLEALVDCCQAVAALNRSGFPAQLTISSPSGHAARHADRLAIDPAIRIVDTIRDDETFFRRIAVADLLLLPVNFNQETVRFIRYSMPTKVPAYLAAGGPILAYGPAETAQMRYAQSDGWAFTLTAPGVDKLQGALRRALEDSEARKRVMAAARDAAARNHDAAVVRRRFQDRLVAAAARTKADMTE